MRSIGAAQMALDTMIQRVTDPTRKTFGKFLYEHGTPYSLNDRVIPAMSVLTILWPRHRCCRHCEIAR